MVTLAPALAETLSHCRALPSLPSVAVRVLELSQDEHATLGDMARVISKDPALCVKILKVANSPLYAPRSPVGHLERAMALMGIRATMSVALSFSVTRSPAAPDGSGFDVAAYWRRALATAVAARTVSRRLGVGDPQECFLAGLLLDLGVVTLHQAMPHAYAALVGPVQHDHDGMAQLELQHFGCHHGQVGAWLLERWKLPANLCLAVELSHGAAWDALLARENGLARVCVLAAQVAGMLGDTNPEPAARAAQDSAERLFHCSTAWLDELVQQVAQDIPVETANLELPAGDAVDLGELLDHAREALVNLSLASQKLAVEAQETATVDALTGVRNRAFLQRELPRLFLEAKAGRGMLSVLFVDVDHFKKVNDVHGHPAGDAVLVSVAHALRATLRGPDVLARYGGEEFMVLLPGTGVAGSGVVAERLRALVAGSPHGSPVANVPVTISVGCATFSENNFATSEDLTQAADRCVLLAKRTGRNRVVDHAQYEASLPKAG